MKDSKIDKYLVPYDFTEATKDAFDYAVTMAKTAGGTVKLIHFVKEETQNPAAEKKLKDFVDSQSDDIKSITASKVMEGSIYHDINSVAESVDASAIVMGSHGKSGLQNVFGSHALKVVKESHIPFIIIQEGTQSTEINDIVMPFNFERESLQITQFATSMAKTFDATIHLVGFRDPDDSLFKQMKINQAVVQKHFVNEKVKYKIVTLPGDDNYETELIDYAKSIGADLFATAYFDTGFRSFFYNFVDELLINEPKIPVITVNGPDVMDYRAKLNYVPI